MLLLPLPVLLLCAVRITLRWSDDCSYSCRFSLLTQACMMFCLISTPYGVFPYYTQKTPQLLLAWVLTIFYSCLFILASSTLLFSISKENLAFFNNCWWSLRKFLVGCHLLQQLHHQSCTHNTTPLLAGSAAAAWLWNGTVYHFSSAAAAARHHARPPASTPFFATRSFASLCLLLSTTEC